MGTASQEMRKALKTYLDTVEGTLEELAEIEGVAETFSTMLDRNHEINLKIEDAVREIGHLQGQREELYQDYFNASFEGDTERISEIEEERNQIDNRIAELEESITVARAKLLAEDGTGIAEMLSRVDNADVSMFFGPRVTGSKLRMANGQYQQMPPTGLIVDLQNGNDKLKAEINATKARIKGLQDWTLYVPKEPASKAHNKLVEALAR